MKAIETATILDKSTGELFLIRCGTCGLPLYRIVWLGCFFYYCSICHKAKGEVLHKN